MLPPPTPLRPGELFAGEFRVVAPLGAGGMGAVWVVEQLRTGKQRALKTMHPTLVADARQRARFEQEARIASRIESDHVVEVIDAGVDPATSVPWIAMELLRGETLAGAIERAGPLSLADAREVFAQLGHALSAAHDAGIVHRDLKPENVFLAAPRRAGARFTLKVLDFGIAKLIAEAGARSTAAIGTPLWMAPEQTESGRAVGPQTDVWSLGLLAFYTLTGRSYWLGSMDDRGGTIAVLREIVMAPMPPASERVRELGAEVALPQGFDVWFAHATARDPRARYPDARAACAALDALLAQAGAAGPIGPIGPFVGTPTPPPMRVSSSAELPARTIASPVEPLPVPPTRGGRTTPHAVSSAPARASSPDFDERARGVPDGSRLRAVLIALIVVASAVTFGSLGMLLWNRAHLPPPPPSTSTSRSVDPGDLAIDEVPEAAVDEEPLPPLASTSATSAPTRPSSTSHPSTTVATAPHPSTSTSASTKPSSTPSTMPSTKPSTKPSVSTTPPLPPPTTPPTPPTPSASSPPVIATGGFDRKAAAAALAGVSYKECGPAGAGAGTVHVLWAATGAPMMVKVEGPYDRTTRHCIRSRFAGATIPPFLDTPHALAWKISL
jgi:serine/threonine protein kinase